MISPALTGPVRAGTTAERDDWLHAGSNRARFRWPTLELRWPAARRLTARAAGQVAHFEGTASATNNGGLYQNHFRLHAGFRAGVLGSQDSLPGAGTAASLMRARIDDLGELSRVRPGLLGPGALLPGIGSGDPISNARDVRLPSLVSGNSGALGQLVPAFEEGASGSVGLGNNGARGNSVVGRLDASLLPFLEVYGMFGYSRGDMGELRAPQLASTAPIQGAHVGFDDQAFEGVTYGGGGQLSGDWDRFYATVDTEFTFTDLDIAEEPFKTFSVAPRIGARSSKGPLKGTFYFGAMFMTVDKDVKAGLNIPGLRGVPLHVDMDITKPWNALVGTEVELVGNFVFSLEGGFLGRRQLTAGVGAKF